MIQQPNTPNTTSPRASFAIAQGYPTPANDPAPPPPGRRRPRTFAIYHHQIHGYVAVKIGWSVPAFFFNPIWLIFKGLWRQLFFVLAIFIIAGIVLNAASGDDSSSASVATAITNFLGEVLGFSAALFIAHEGNRWLADKLVRRGFVHVATQAARNRNEAINLAMAGMCAP